MTKGKGFVSPTEVFTPANAVTLCAKQTKRPRGAGHNGWRAGNTRFKVSFAPRAGTSMATGFVDSQDRPARDAAVESFERPR
jgi:hypothetical protein